MAPNLTSGTFQVVSLVDDKSPVGVGLILPAFQAIRLNARVTAWTVTEEGENIYRLGVGSYPFTGPIDNKIFATVHEAQNVEWIATYKEVQDAYMISPVDNDRAVVWTVADSNDPNSRIALRTGIMLPTFPPRYLTSQLFRFEEIDA